MTQDIVVKLMKQAMDRQIAPMINDIHANVAYAYYAMQEGCFTVTMVGDSMDMANIPDGSLAMIHRQNKVKDGEIGAVRINGAVAIRRIYDKHTHLVLAPASTNPVYQPQVFSPADKIEILGKVRFALVSVG